MKKEQIKQNIIFDIDSSSIGVLVFESGIKGNNLQNEIFSTREFIFKENHINFDYFFKKTMDVFKSVSKKAHRYSGNNIGNIYLNISSPWASSQIRKVSFSQENSFIFTKKIEKKIYDKELSKPIHYTSDFFNKNNISIIEREVLDVFLNGYKSQKPYGKKVESVEIRSFVSVMSNYTKNMFIETIEESFHKKPIFFSNKFMNYQSIVSLFKKEKDIISFDISGEVTEIILILNGQLKKIGTIPIGLNHILRSLSVDMKISFLKAESILMMYQNNELEERYREIIHHLMKKSFYLWFKEVYEFLGKVSDEFIIPNTFHILSPNNTYNWFREWILSTEEIYEYMHISKNINIIDLRLLWRSMKDKLFNNVSDDNLALCLDFIISHYGEKK